MSRQERWDKIRNPKCEKCGLCKLTSKVCLIGKGDLRARLFVVGDYAGYDSERPLAGRSGALLDTVLSELNIDRAEIYVTNVMHCRPPDNHIVSKEEMQACMYYLEKELAAVKPEIIVPLGNLAMEALIKKKGITKYRGMQFNYEAKWGKAVVIPTFHPAACLRNPKNLPAMIEDFDRIYALLTGKVKRDKIQYIITNSGMIDHAFHFIDQAQKVGRFSFDVETTGLDWFNPKKKIVTLSLCCEKGRAVVIPLNHPSGNLESDCIDELLETLNTELFSNKKVEKIGHNMKFDLKWLSTIGIKIKGPIFDTMLAHYILDENSRHGLDHLSLRHTKHGEYWKEVESKVSNGKADELPLDELARYNAIDAEVTFRLRNILGKQLEAEPKLNRLFNNLIMPLTKSLLQTERKGMLVDVKYLKKLQATFTQEIEKQTQSLMIDYPQCRKYIKANGSINFNSGKQMQELLFDAQYGFGFKPVNHSPKGAPSVDEETLVELSFHKTKGSFPRKLLDLRKIKHLDSTYVTGMWKHLGPDNRVHPNFKIHGTVTGRLSCSDPNLQNIPRVEPGAYDNPLKATIKKMFIAPKGYVLLQIDQSQSELRIMTDFSGEERMAQWFKEGKDLHLAVAAEQHGIPEEKVTKPQRKGAKTINFGIIFCVESVTLAKSLSSPEEGIFVTPEQAQKFKDNYFRKFPKIKQFIDRQQKRALEIGFVETKFGRRRRLPDIHSDNKGIAREAARQAVNAPIQGTSGEMCEFAIVMMTGTLDGKRKIPKIVWIINTVHDSTVMEVPERMKMRIAKKVKFIYENLPTKKYFGFTSTVPMVVDVEVGKNWAEMEKLKLSS